MSPTSFHASSMTYTTDVTYTPRWLSQPDAVRGSTRPAHGQISSLRLFRPRGALNLIGGLDAIGFAVIKLALSRMDGALSEASATGVELALCSARICVGLYTADSRLYRQVLVRVPKALFDGTHLGQDTAQTAIRAMAEAKQLGEIVGDVDPERLGRTIYVNYLGALYDWACGDSGDADFRRAAQVAVLAPVAACATEATRTQLTARLLATLFAASEEIAVGGS